ncbi:MAG: hypothetical protein ACI9R3_005201 [Verrucomicrobiales bacterium]|jgi:hypothetical protein
MDVRSFIESDREGLQQVYIESRKAAFRWQDTARFLPGDFEKDTDGEAIWVAIEEGIPVGSSQLSLTWNWVSSTCEGPRQHWSACETQVWGFELQGIGILPF